MKRNYWLVAVLSALALLTAACSGGAGSPSEAGQAAASATENSAGGAATEPADNPTAMAQGKAQPSGPACDQLPAGGEAGSASAMSAQPAATAASSNPLLSTLVTAVGQAGLVDTLNSEGPFTIFAPVNDAFAAIPEADLNALLADQAALTNVLTYHVYAGEALDSQALAGMDRLTMVNGGAVTLAPSGESLSVNGQAKVVCANLVVGNGVVHLIDGVLMPTP